MAWSRQGWTLCLYVTKLDLYLSRPFMILTFWGWLLLTLICSFPRHVRCWLRMLGLPPSLLLALVFCIFSCELQLFTSLVYLFFRIIFLIISGTFFENKMYICMKHKMPIRLRGWLLWPQESFTSKPLRKMVQIKIVIFWLYLPRLYFFLVFPYSNFLWHLNPSVS